MSAARPYRVWQWDYRDGAVVLRGAYATERSARRAALRLERESNARGALVPRVHYAVGTADRMIQETI